MAYEAERLQAHGVEIIESYRLPYEPTVRAGRIVAKLISGTDPKYLAGLSHILLTDTGGLNHARRRAKTWSRQHKVRISECQGLYHHGRRGEPAWIEIFVDNTLNHIPRSVLRVPVIREMFLADIVFHEVGHHIEVTKVPGHGEREDLAEKWNKHLTVSYFRKHRAVTFFIVRALNLVLRPLMHWLSRCFKRTRK